MRLDFLLTIIELVHNNIRCLSLNPFVMLLQTTLQVLLLLLFFPTNDYLQKEFPEQFKKKEPPLHPSKQLEVFLKRCGNEGWELKSTESVGGLLMFIFMKPKISITKSKSPKETNPPQ